jgi:hypothetical protein
MTAPSMNWEDIYRRDRDLSIASMTPTNGPANAIQQRGYVAPGSTTLPSGPSQARQITTGAADAALMANPELIGKAHFWGIPPEVASSMPMDQLEHIIQQHEMQAHQAADQAGGWSQFATAVAAVPAMFGVGAMKAVLETPRNIPIVGEFFRKQQTLNNAIAGTADLEEGVRSATRSDFQWVNSTMAGAGSLAALWYPGAAAWRAAAIAGKVPSLIGIASPIARMAAQGGAAGWLLEGGGDHAQSAVIGGAVLGGLAHPVEKALEASAPAIAAAMDRVSKYFDGPWSRFVKPMPGPTEVAADAVAKAAGIQQPMQDMAAASHVDDLRRMATDPAATPETRQQAQEMLNYLQPNGGTTRFYHGGMEYDGSGGRWVTPDPAYARGWSQSGSGEVQYVDIPNNHPELRKAFDDTGTDQVAPFQPFEMSPELSRGLRPLNSIPFEQQGMNVGDAAQSAAQMSKSGLIIDSPILGKAAGQTMPNDGTVAHALSETNPGGTNIVPAVANPAEFMQQVGMNPDAMPHVRFARRAGRTQLDALLSDEPITDKMIAQYEEHGVFTGQAAQTAAGRDVIVGDIHEGLATVTPTYGGAPHYVPVSDLLPSATTAVARPVPGLYEELGAYVQQRVSATADAMGGSMDTQLLGRMRNEGMPGYIEDFLDEMKVTDKGERARIRQYFNERVVEDYSAAVPEESAFQRHMETQAAMTEAASPEETPLRKLDRMGQSKGFMVVPDGATGGYRLIDQIATPVGTQRPPTSVLFESREAAEEWLKNLSRPAPDVTPPVDVPMEIARTVPTQSHLEPALDNNRLQGAVEASAADVASSIREIDPALGDHVRQVIQEAKASGNLGRIHQAWEYGMSQFQPMRARWATISSRLAEAGLGDLRPWDDWDTLTTALSKKHNWEHPWMDRWATITDHFGAEDLRNGTVTSIYEIEDDALRLRKAQEAGFGPRQIAALDEMHQFFRELFPSTGLDPAREIARYISHVRARQSMGASVTDAFEGYAMNPTVEPFYEMVRSGNMQLRELDARNLGNIYVRSLGFQKFMRADWDAATAKWRGVAQIEELKPLANHFMNWANLMKTGYVPGNDMALDMAHSVMQMMMPGFTKAQTARVFNQGLSVTHLALLGYRPDVMARDSIQLFLALPRAGADLLAVMKDMATMGSAARQEMFNRGLEAGTVILGKPRIAGSGVFEPHMAGVMPGTPQTGMEPGMAGMQLVEQEGARGPLYKVLQATSDALHDLVPDSMRHLEGSKLHPLYFYTRQSEQMRLVVGEAGIRRASRALADYRAAGEGASMDQLMGDSMARTFDPSVQQKFKDLVASGRDTEASHFIARQLTDATMFRYGMVENPEIARSTFGKIGMQMGNFSTQFYQYAKESLRNGNWQDKAKFLAMMGGVTAGLNAAEKATGWAFSKWQFYNSLAFAGGPWISNLMDAQKVASDVTQMAYRQDGQAGGQYLLDDANSSLAGLGYGLGQMMNPVGGLMRDAGGIASVMDSPDPLNAFGRLMITGQRGNTVDWQNIEMQTFGTPQFQQQPQMQPYSNPVSGSRVGQPVQFPQPHPPVGPLNPAPVTSPAGVYGTGISPDSAAQLRKITGGGAQF